uniref:Lipoxygenase domain-containing protein n=1 Tax=Capra hircus TaxID=9925 RepID=A0A8C2RZT1_CAPHI
MVQRAMQDLTYTSLCFPEAIKARGMDNAEDIPYYFYRDDGLLVWEAIKTFVAEVVDIYYEGDQVVEEDPELQDFVKDVYMYGMRGKKASGFPKSLKTKEKLCEYLTVVIFTASAQHAAVNFGQVGKDRASLLGGRWPGQLSCLRALGGLHHLLHRSGGGGAEGPGVWCSQGPVEFVLEFVPSTGCQCEGGGFPGPTGVGGGGSGRRPGRQSWVRAALAGGHPAGSVTVPQYDWCSWIPNAPPTMRAPPPTAKGVVTIEQIVDTLPDRGRSCWHLGAVWALSQFQDNELFLGMYPEEHFIEKPVKEAMARFRKNLDSIVSVIAERNKNKKLPYYYLSPDRIPNSVAI